MATNNKLREALENVAKQLIDATEDKNFGEDVMYLVGCMRTMSRKCRAALAEPVRNCEVGTVKEQTERFDAFCQSNMKFYRDMFGHDDEGRLDGWDCREDCPVGRMIDSGAAVPDHCQLAWAQMPYEKGGDR